MNDEYILYPILRWWAKDERYFMEEAKLRRGEVVCLGLAFLRDTNEQCSKPLSIDD